MKKLSTERSRNRLKEAEEKRYRASTSYKRMSPNNRQISAKDVDEKLKVYSDKTEKVQNKLPKPKSSVSKSFIPDASNVKRSEATGLRLKPSSEGIPSVGQRSELKGSILSGLSPSAIKKVELKIAPAIPTPDSGFGLLNIASSKLKQENPVKVPSTSMKSVVEGVINGRTKIYVGRQHKMTLEAANVNTVRSIVEGYTGVGRNVKVVVETGSRNIFKNNNFANLMIEAVHYSHHGLSKLSETKKTAAFNLFKKSIAKEYVPFYHGSKKTWVSESVTPAFKQLNRDFKKIYNGLLKEFEVTVRVEKKSVTENVNLITRAINENCAAANAFDEISATDGLNTKIKHAFVGTKKFLPEADNKSPLTTVGKFFVDDMPKVKMTYKASDGRTASVKGDKPKKLPDYNGSGKYTYGKTSKTVEKTKTRSSINPEKFVKKQGGPVNYGSIPAHVRKGTEPLADNGPVFETTDLNPEKIISKLSKSTKSSKTSKILKSISDKLANQKDLSDKEEKIVDMVMDVAMAKVLL